MGEPAKRTILSAVLLFGAVVTPGSGQVSDSTELLEAIPASCWGFVTVPNPRGLDDSAQRLLERMALPPTRPLESLEARLSLGPRINRSGGMAVVMMPSLPGKPPGDSAVLLFACPSVESLLTEFTTERVEPGLWQAELVWGPTYVGQKGGFAVFGTSAQTTRSVMQDRTSLVRQWSQQRLSVYRSGDLSVWLSGAGMIAAMQQFLGPESEPDATAVFTNAIHSAVRRYAAAIDNALIVVDLDDQQLRGTAVLELQRASALAEMLAFEGHGDRSWLNLLPDHPMILAAGAAVTRRQMDAKVAEFDAVLQAPAIGQATVPDKLMRFRTLLQNLVRSVRGAAWGLSARSQSPEGLATLVAVIRVDSAEAWLADVAGAAALLNDGFFASPAANTYYRSVSYTTSADTVNGHRVDHLVLDLLPGQEHPDPQPLNYAAALGPPRKVIQLAVADPRTVAICLGDQPRVLFELIESAAAADTGLQQSTSLAALQPLLSADASLTALFWPGELVRIARLLAQRQDQVEAFGYGQLEVGTPIAATLNTARELPQIEVVLPVDVLTAAVTAHLQRRTEQHRVTPPPSGN